VDIDEPTRISLSSFKSLLIPFTIIQIYLAQKQYSKTLTLAALLFEDNEKRKIGHYRICLLLWQALAYHGLRQEAQAMTSLKQALTLAAPEGYIRIFIVEGSKLIPLLHQALTAGIMPDYMDRLLAAYAQEAKHQPMQAAIPSGLVEPLSAREIEVLKLLAQGCTDKKIAETLFIARETVHKHLKNIYGKLDVHSRTEAIIRARELKLF
jgi:LuxR family maltose regulon positive regulatory protein